MEYKKYQHIEKLGTTEVEGILEGVVYLFYKIDGTNSCVFLKADGNLGYGSRKRELSIQEDNQGFMETLETTKELHDSLLKLLTGHPSYIIYGEWLVPHTIKRYKQDAWRTFYIFDVFDSVEERYLSYDEYLPLLKEHDLNYIPLLASLENPSMEDIRNCLSKTGEFLITEGLGEGIVIKNYNYRNCYGRTTWAKILTEDFMETKQRVRKNNEKLKETSPIEYQIVEKFLTPEFITKEFEKFKEEHNGFSSKNIFEFLNRTFLEFYKDNWELIFKKFKFPTINFKVLKKLVEDEIKSVLSI